MAKATNIPYADHTFSPWWGCVKVSPGCANCYAEQVDKRRGGGHWGKDGPRLFMAESTWKQPLAWNRAAERAGERRCVVISMCDPLEVLPLGHPQRFEQDKARARLWRLIDATPWLCWLVLTKRPDNFARRLPLRWETAISDMSSRFDPPSNFWPGVSVESQDYVWRVGELLKISAAKHIVSAEPLLGPLELDPPTCQYCGRHDRETIGVANDGATPWCTKCDSKAGYGAWLDDIDLVICGCESGPKRRPFELDWVRSLRDQCARADVPFYLKQIPINNRVVVLPELDGVQHKEMPR